MRRLMRACLAAGVVAGLGSAASAQTGDLCNDAIAVSEGSTPFNSAGFTNQMSASCADSGSDIFFIYTPTATGYATIDTCGSSFDTVLSIVIDCAFETQCNDDSCGLQSSIGGVQVYEGISIFIRVGAYGLAGAGGSGVLNINVTPPAQWDEQIHGFGDAGETIATAQVPEGSGPFNSISGAIDYFGDTDMYLINICDPSTFTATTFGSTSTDFDTRLYLFDPSGHGVAFNDDVPTGNPGDTTFLSRLSNSFVAAPGNYYLAVTFYDNACTDSAGDNIWNELPYDVERAPDGPGAGNPLDSWIQGGFDVGNYWIQMTGVCFPGGGPGCDPDLNQDGNADQDDVSYLINVIGGGANPTGIDPDFNHDGNADQDDVSALINAIGGGGCP